MNTMKRYAIILSAENYVEFSPTPYCHADATLIRKTLMEKCDYAAQHVLSLQLEPNGIESPLTILEKIQETINNSRPGDTILFYFAGHGHKAKDDRTYLLLPDTTLDSLERTGLPLDDISDLLRQAERPCFRIFDACHSGADVRDVDSVPNSKGFIREVTHDPVGWVTLAACREDQYSVSDSKLGQGIFTHYLCEFIDRIEKNEDILPELLKIGIVDGVVNHARRLGFMQTPTLNASISGNISLATRRTGGSEKKSGESDDEERVPLSVRISGLRGVPDIIQKDFLEQALKSLVSAMEKNLESELTNAISTGSEISASDIPSSMKRDIVILAQRQGWNSRHELERWEEETEIAQPPWQSAVMATFYPPTKRKEVYYRIAQPTDMPKSACIINLEGDGRCIPEVSVLVYIIPLQLRVGLIVSAFRKDWPPNEYSLKLLSHSSETLRPEDKPEHAGRLAASASDNICERLTEYVTKRVDELERELR